MGAAAAITGILGGLSIIMGILDAMDIFRQSGLAPVDWSFWFLLAIALFLAAITLLIGRQRNSGQQ